MFADNASELCKPVINSGSSLEEIDILSRPHVNTPFRVGMIGSKQSLEEQQSSPHHHFCSTPSRTEALHHLSLKKNPWQETNSPNVIPLPQEMKDRHDSGDRLLALESDQAVVGDLTGEDSLLPRETTEKQLAQERKTAKLKDDTLTGFVVADAHFGWRDPRQPSVEVSQQMLQRIHQRFPNLDVFLDAGDATHSAREDAQRAQWLTYLSGEFSQMPLYYVAGNHEIAKKTPKLYSYEYDPEERATQMGSNSVRPYYSFDLKGIHIISLPPFMNPNYLNAEELAWLKLDLEINQDKTIIIVSHNSLRGTTSNNGRKVYREFVNSDAIFDLMDQYDNIRAWIHGHNHSYEVVEKEGNLFVSAGRMGGFSPAPKRFASNNLGGFYFKVSQDALTVRAYSASEQKFIDKLGYPDLSKKIRFETSLDVDAPSSVSYGYGLARDGQRIPAYNHHVNATQRELFISGSPGSIFSDNPRFEAFTEDKYYGSYLSAVGVYPKNAYRSLDPSIRLRRRDPGEETKVILPGTPYGRWLYYRTAPDQNYTATLELDAVEGGQQAQLEATVYDSDGNLVASLPADSWQLTEGKQTLRYDFYVPDLSSYPSIYTDDLLDNQFQVSVQARFTNMDQHVTLQQFDLRLSDATNSTSDPEIIVDGNSYKHTGNLIENEYVRFNLPVNTPKRSVFETQASGSGLLTFLVRETGLQWQVRNAVATQSGNDLLIGPMRNHFDSYHEILIAPMGDRTQPYLNRLENVEQARVTYTDSGVEIELLELHGSEAKLTLVAQDQPREIRGAQGWSFEDGLVEITALDGALINIDF